MAWLTPLYRLYERRLLHAIDREGLPHHIGVILDGHRRHARRSGMASYTESYQAGMDRFVEFVGWSADLDIPAVTGWLLSVENLSRPADELDPYFDVLIDLFGRLPDVAARHNMELRFIGSLDVLPERLSHAAKAATENSATADRHLNIAVGYAGRQEIVDACRDLILNLNARGVGAGELADHVTAEALASHMYAADLPDPDLLIRTSGESRLSGFMLWQSAYSEFAFVDVYWPAFRRVDLLRALRDFSRRERRFGQ